MDDEFYSLQMILERVQWSKQRNGCDRTSLYIEQLKAPLSNENNQ